MSNHLLSYTSIHRQCGLVFVIGIQDLCFPERLSALFSVAGRGPCLQFFASNCTLTEEIGIATSLLPPSLPHPLSLFEKNFKLDVCLFKTLLSLIIYSFLVALGALTPLVLSTLVGLSVRLSSTLKKRRGKRRYQAERAVQDGSCQPDDGVTQLQVDWLAVRPANPHPGHVSLHSTKLATTPSFSQHLA